MKNNYNLKFLLMFLCFSLSFEGLAQLYTFTAHTFTPAGATGQNGPNLVACQAAYASESWSSDPSFFNMTTNGIQEWTVPATGNYSIESYGAQGGDDVYSAGPSIGGLGASMYGEFSLTEGQILHILVGQEGINTVFTSIDNAGAGGGGGSFVWDPLDLTAPLIAAGGGGGGCSNTSVYLGSAANATMDGNNSEFLVNAGTGGNGGTSNAGGSSYWAGAGAGWLTNGTGGNNTVLYDYLPVGNAAEAGRSAINGGVGGTRWNDGLDEGGDGGFGGGGGGGSDNMGSGGGGGYSGGGGDRGATYGDGGGGGSFNAGSAQVNTAGINVGDGFIIITQLCVPLITTVSDDTVCVGDMVTLSASSTGTGTISWDGGVVDGVPFSPGAGTTTYTATSTDVDDCPFSIAIFVGDFPTVDAGADQDVCEGDSTMLVGTGTATDWSWDGGIADGVNFLPPAGTTTYTLTGTIDSTGCQATDMVDVTVIVPDVSITASGTTLICNQSGASYQWLDCPGMTPIAGAVTQIFTPPGDGDYAVIVTLSGCSDTSACQPVYTGFEDSSKDLVLRVYPNPTEGKIQISNEGAFDYTLMNLLGEVILNGSALDQTVLNISDQARGAYFLKVTSEGMEKTVKLIKQ
ncbi:T9SS type A sorting domain-containing protein [Crocinitomix catalasitica]|nr:T9SS type A sorting domain-containing protein [Crocinitomix catalasitica]